MHRSVKRYLPMKQKEMEELLKRARIMALAVVDGEGKPHNTPVWFIYWDGKLYFRVQPYKKKFKLLLGNPWVSCTVEEGRRYTELRGISILGKARVIRDEARASFINRLLQLKYSWERNYHDMPEEWRKRYEHEPREIVEVEPIRIASWDNRRWIGGDGDKGN